LKLKRVEMQGFKSFVDRTVLEFDRGITAILGPNGCGKSNIVDAIRWVLGEQSAKQLRGEKMEDIIFKGTAKRKPISLAEVSLVFSNEDHAIPVEFDEVSIKRRVSRDGFSQYYLNGSPVRLKDLRDLFFDSGVNNTAYSVIEQEKISRVLNENREEVRLLIEEGAGIVKYKARRKEAQRKLGQTQHDLLRLRDIIEEIGREVRSLQRQVGKARRYRRLYGEIRALDLAMADRSWTEMETTESELGEKRQVLDVDIESDSGELAELRAKVESTRPAVDEREAERHGLEESLQAFEEDLHRTEQRAMLLEQRIEDHKQRLQENTEMVADTCSRREATHSEIHGLEERRIALTTEVEALAGDLERAEEELKLTVSRFDENRHALEQASQINLEFIETDNKCKSEMRELEIRLENRRERMLMLDGEEQAQGEALAAESERRSGLEQDRERIASTRRGMLEKLVTLEHEIQSAVDDVDELRDEISGREARRESLRSRHDMLRRLAESYEGYGGGARSVLQSRADDPRVLGSLADRLTIADGWSEALEGLLGELVDSIVVDGATTALELVTELRREGKGRAGFLLSEIPIGADPAPEPPAGGRRAAELVGGEATAIPHLARLLSRTWAFEDDESALAAAVANAGAATVICLSRNGLLVTSDGVVRGGKGRGEEIGLLGRAEKLEKLAGEITAIDAAIDGARSKQTAAVQRRDEFRTRFETAKQELAEVDAELGRLHVDAAESRSRCEVAEARLAAVARDRETLQAEENDFRAELEKISGTIDQSGRMRTDSSLRLDELRRMVTEGEQERDLIRADVEHKRLTRSRLEGEVRELAATLGHLRVSVAEMTAGEERLRQEIELGRKEIESMEKEIIDRRAKLEQGLDERERRRLLVQAAAEAISSLHQETAVWHERIKEIEDKRSNCRESIHAIETELATMEVRRANLVERIEEQYKGSFRELVRSYDPEALPKELELDGDVFQIAQARDLLEVRRSKMSSLGPVNHLAVEEYEQKSERLQFLEKQLADVEKARDDLETTIERINRTARKLFQETFEEVRRNYIAVFQTLFEGGRADLEMLRTDDPLESNLRIIAQPKGKRVDHIRLLSGGERCMTALALLFAVYLVKPSPFCLLDEADAPLDDANVHRFVRMLQEFSKDTQFLVVTHNKLTMEIANHLYGVTMMEQGVSSLVSVSFQDVAASHDDADLGQAIAARRKRIDRDSISITLDEQDAPAAAQDGESRITLSLDGDPEQDDDVEQAEAVEPDDVGDPQEMEADQQDDSITRAMEAGE